MDDLLKKAEQMVKEGSHDFAMLSEAEAGETLADENTEVKEQILNALHLDLGMYPSLDSWVAGLPMMLDKPSENVPTESLNVNGRVVQDKMEVYLNDNRFRIHEDGSTSGYLQSSDLKEAAKTPRHLLFKINVDSVKSDEKLVIEQLRDKQDKNKKHFEFGEAMHACILEPTRFGRYVVEPNASMSSNEGCDTLIDFWNEKLMEKLAKDYTGEELKEVYESVIWGLIKEKDFLFKANVKQVLVKCADTVEKAKKDDSISAKVLASQLKMYQQFYLQEATVSGINKLIKELEYKKNEPEKLNDQQREALLQLCSDALGVELEQLGEVSKTDILFRKLDEKKQLIEILETYCDLEKIDEETYTQIKALEYNFKTYAGGILPKLLKWSKREVSVYCNDYDGLPLRVRPDAMQFKENIGVDMVISVKSTRTEKLDKYFYDAAKMGYDLSEGMYQEVCSTVTGRDFRSTLNIIFQTQPPFCVGAIFWKPEDLAIGTYKFKQAHELTKDVLEKEVWPGFEVFAQEGNFGMIESNLPWWAGKEAMPTNVE